MYHLAVCADVCNSDGTYSGGNTCGLICQTNPLGPFGSSTGSVGSTGTCNDNSTFCRGGTYTVMRNTYSTVNFDCANAWGFGCGNYGGCCVRIGDPSSPALYCIKCDY